MLYPKSKEPQLSDELFRNPGKEYRGTPFWAWNCELDKEELLWQLEVLKKMGMGGAHMHVRTGMATPYLSNAHMDLIQSCVEKCRREDMLAWLYDEDRWPSGAAGGIVTKDPAYRQRHLLFTVHPYDDNTRPLTSAAGSGMGSRSNNGRLLACYDILLDSQGCLAGWERLDGDVPARGTKWYVYLETAPENPWFNNQTYVDTLNPAAMRRFIQVTYERYLETVGKDFGGIVPAVFTDEPQFTQKRSLGFAEDRKDILLPWTEDIPETFLAAYGEDILENLPQLLWELPNGQISTVRYHYHDHICQRFTQAFADQCGTWCGNHGLMLTGHMMEEPTLHSQTAALGEAMRSYRSFQLPGIDMLCDFVELTTAKQAQSACRQYGREGMLSEMYGVTGWDFDFRGHKFQGDWQAALGVTVRVHHLAWVSMKGEAKRDYPASINYQSPWWKDYALVENHFARVNTALTRGKAEVRVGVIHPIESYWLHFGPSQQTAGIRSQMENNFKNITSWLLNGSIDFDFISESLLPELCPQGSAPLQVGAMAYDTIIVPGCETLRSTTLERLEAFRASGGRLIFLGSAPKYEDALPSSRGDLLWKKSLQRAFTAEAVLDVLAPVRSLDIHSENGSRTSNLVHQLRRDGDDRWLFIAHSKKPYHKDIPQCQNIRITLEGVYSVKKYDTQTGDIILLDSVVTNGKTVVQVKLHDLDSLLLRYSMRESVPAAVPVQKEGGNTLRVPQRVAYTLDEPNVYLLDKAEFALDDGPYRPAQELLRADNILRQELGWPMRKNAVAQPWTVHESEPEHTVRLRFTVNSTVALRGVKLALEDADLAKIACNGRPITAPSDGWYTDKCIQSVSLGELHKGENIIEITLPFGRRTNVEWCYLLGDFGVQIYGEYRELTPPPETLGFDDVTRQGLAHYGGNITYHIPVTTAGGPVALVVPHYAGTAVRVCVNNADSGYIAYPPYRLELPALPAGEHIINLTLLGNRHNCFGPVHLADPKALWIGPNAWRTTGDKWTDSYRLKPLGILSAPRITEENSCKAAL